MQLKLTKPLIFFDLETTGINITHDRIVEISIIRVSPSGEEKALTFRINPGMPIPPEATQIHHISDSDVAQAPTFKEKAQELANLFKGCDIAGFNSVRFDIPMLSEEFNRAGVKFDFTKARFIDVQTIFHKREQRNLSAAYRFYCGKELTGAHGAAADTRATYEVLMAQYDRYPDLPHDIETLSQYSAQNRNVDLMGRIIFNDRNQETINFGKYKGTPVEEVLAKDPGYYSWIMRGDFAQNTKDILTAIKLRMRNA